MVLVQASKLSLSSSSSSPHSTIQSLLFEPTSNSLALMHSDSSLSLYPSLSLLSSLSSLPPTTKTLISSPSSSASFLLLRQNNHDPNPTVLFLVASPHRAGSQILIKLYLLQDGNNDSGKSHGFVRAKKVVCNQKGVQIDDKLGALLDVNHGVGVKLVGSVNFLALYSISNAKIWVFGVRLVNDSDGDVVVKLMRCCVIECCRPVWEIRVSFGLMVLGEENGVRVFNLRQLMKGKISTVKNSGLNGKSQVKGLKLLNAVTGNDSCWKSASEVTCNGSLDRKIDKHSVSVKQKSVKYNQESSERVGCFIAFESKEADGLKSSKMPLMSVKAVSIEALCPQKFLILDSIGELHVLHVSKPVVGSSLTCHIKQLPHFMKVQKFAVLPDSSSGLQTVWISDGSHSLHMMSVSDMDTAADGNDRTESEEKLMQISVVHVVFSSEKIEDVVPSAANGVLVLAQGSIYAYGNS